jgi:16S rRNA (guanine527-N7)-methyltransferase
VPRHPAALARGAGGPPGPARGSTQRGMTEASEDPREASEDGAEDRPAQGASSRRRRADADPDEELLHADTPVPGLDELRAALDWAFAGEDAPAPLLDRFAAHARLVLEGNRVMNLTAVVEPREVAAKHYLDSWRATRLIPLLGRALVDLGSGAGFPGVPVALTERQAQMTLVDSMGKRAEFLQRVVDELGLENVSVAAERGEEYLQRNRCDIVFMRAISSVRENVRLLRKVKHSLKDLVLLKGPSWSREARAAEREAERLGFRLDTVWEHELPEDMGKRAILVYRAPGGH